MTEDFSKINETQRLIIEAVVACIEKYGIENVTIRRIAEEAQVNIASINYYFRSKANLMDATLRLTIGHMLEDALAVIDNQDISLQERLEEVLFYIVEGATRFPQISTAHLYDAVVSKNYDSPGAVGVRAMFEGMLAKVIEELPQKPEEQIRFALAQTLQACFFLMLAPGLLKLPAQYRPGNARCHRDFARQSTRMFFAALE